MAAKNILIVEDDPTIVILISTVLKSRGYSVTTARTGNDALAKVQTS
jgi:CheY-like chemotaxis protein